MLHGIRLVDGRMIKAETWEDVETGWQNDFMNAIVEPKLFRKDIEQRARLWSGIEIEITGTAYDFLLECERAGLLTTINDATALDDISQFAATKPVSRIVFLDHIRDQVRRRAERQATEG